MSWRRLIYDVTKMSHSLRLKNVRFEASWSHLAHEVLKTFDLRHIEGACWQILQNQHCVISVQIWNSFWSVFSCIQSEYRKMPTRKNPVFGHFSRRAEVKKEKSSSSLRNFDFTWVHFNINKPLWLLNIKFYDITDICRSRGVR